ncbi:hypothetical protein D3C79_833780 [compost metagenome]
MTAAGLDAQPLFPLGNLGTVVVGDDGDEAHVVGHSLKIDKLELAGLEQVVVGTNERAAQGLFQIVHQGLGAGVDQQRVVAQLQDLEGDRRGDQLGCRRWWRGRQGDAWGVVVAQWYFINH